MTNQATVNDQTIYDHINQHDERWAKLFVVCKSALSLAQENLQHGSASDVISTQNKARSGASRSIDIIVEDYIVSHLINKHTTILSEERGFASKTNAKFFAILDPIDGTDVALRGMDFYSISLAFGPLERGKVFMRNIEFSIVCSPISTFYAIKGKGAYQNGRLIHTRKTRSIRKAILRIPKLLTLPTKWIRNTKTVVCLGSTALEICFVANGFIDCYVETKKRKVFDYAAAALIISEAGGMITTLDCKPLWAGAVRPLTRSTLLAAANRQLLEEVQREAAS